MAGSAGAGEKRTPQHSQGVPPDCVGGYPLTVLGGVIARWLLSGRAGPGFKACGRRALESE